MSSSVKIEGRAMDGRRDLEGVGVPGDRAVRASSRAAGPRAGPGMAPKSWCTGRNAEAAVQGCRRPASPPEGRRQTRFMATNLGDPCQLDGVAQAGRTGVRCPGRRREDVPRFERTRGPGRGDLRTAVRRQRPGRHLLPGRRAEPGDGRRGRGGVVDIGGQAGQIGPMPGRRRVRRGQGAGWRG